MQWPSSAPPDLADDVGCTWRATMSAGERLVPDGCIDLLWIASREQLWVCGPERRSWTSSVPEGTRAVGVRLRPGAAPHLLRMDANHLTDVRVTADQIMPARADRALRDRLAEAPDPLGVLVDEVRRRRRQVDGRSPSDAFLARRAMEPRPVGVQDVADDLGITSRQLHRRSQRLFGYGYSVLVRLVRLQRFLHLVHRSRGLSLAQAAALGGYADQSHLHRECRSVTGLTPTALLAESGATFPLTTSDPYKTPARPQGALMA